MKDVTIYKWGLHHLSVCSSLSPEETVERVNSMHITGIMAKWQMSEDKKFATGETNPCPCENHPETHKHYLLKC